jgi:hypothetical protein
LGSRNTAVFISKQRTSNSFQRLVMFYHEATPGQAAGSWSQMWMSTSYAASSSSCSRFVEMVSFKIWRISESGSRKCHVLDTSLTRYHRSYMGQPCRTGDLSLRLIPGDGLCHIL